MVLYWNEGFRISEYILLFQKLNDSNLPITIIVWYLNKY